MRKSSIKQKFSINKIDKVFLTDEYFEKGFQKEKTTEGKSDSKYDYRNFRLELMPDGKTAVILYSYAYHESYRSPERSSHHYHHHDDD